MRAGVFELAIVEDGTRVPLPEVSAPGRSYAVAQPGQEFQVLFQFSVMAPNTVYKVQLWVDGRSVGCTKIYKAGRANKPAYFKDFLTERGSDGSCTYHGFQFATPQQDTSKVLTSIGSLPEGKLVCEVWEVQLRGVRDLKPKKHAVPDATVAALPEGNKFFMGPSLTAAAGAAAKKEQKHRDLRRGQYKRVGQGPVARLELHYETAATLLLRGVLKLDTNPEHRRIVDACTGGGQQQQQQLQQGEAGGPSGRRGAKKRPQQKSNAVEQQEQGRQQRERSGAKRRMKQQQQQQQAGGGEPEEIDLTRWHPRPNDPLLAAKREMKDLECDLTGEAEELQWRESKRLAIEID